MLGVRKFVNGDIEVDFYHEDEVIQYRYSSDSSGWDYHHLQRKSQYKCQFPMLMPKTQLDPLENCLIHIELEEWGDDDLDDEIDGDLILDESWIFEISHT